VHVVGFQVRVERGRVGIDLEEGSVRNVRPPISIRWQLCVTRVTAVLDMVVIPVLSVVG
jgi:hypothetical protein